MSLKKRKPPRTVRRNRSELTSPALRFASTPHSPTRVSMATLPTAIPGAATNVESGVRETALMNGCARTGSPSDEKLTLLCLSAKKK